MSGFQVGDIVDITARGVRVHRVFPTSRWSAQESKMVPIGEVLAFTHPDEHLDGYIQTVNMGSAGVAVTRPAPCREAWQRSLPNPLADMFAVGTVVRHLNPKLSDWAGVVTPEPDTGRFLKTNDHSVFGEGIKATVHIQWQHLGFASWFGVESIAPVTGGDR